jgi:hypothetical protein
MNLNEYRDKHETLEAFQLFNDCKLSFFCKENFINFLVTSERISIHSGIHIGSKSYIKKNINEVLKQALLGLKI